MTRGPGFSSHVTPAFATPQAAGLALPGTCAEIEMQHESTEDNGHLTSGGEETIVKLRMILNLGFIRIS
jgi:hypothetical protein